MTLVLFNIEYQSIVLKYIGLFEIAFGRGTQEKWRSSEALSP